MTPPPAPVRLLNAVSEAVSAVAGFLADIGAWLLDMAMAAPITTVAAVATAAAVWVGGRCALRRARHRRWLVGARLVTVLAPPRVDPDGAAALWGHLAGLARPGWRRLLFGQPHLSFEYLITPEGSTIRMWVPGPVPPGLVEHAVAAAWPGATTRTNPAEQDASATRDGAAVRDVAEVGDVAAVRGSSTEAGRGGPTVTAGGVLRLARPGGLPIAEDTPGDPVAALLAAPGDLQTPRGPRAADGCGPAGDWVIVQVLARPAAASPLARSRGSVPGGLLGALGAIAVWGVREVLTLITPGPLSASDPAGRGPRTTTAANGEDARTRLARSSGDRAAIAKARGPAFETLIRYAATAVVPDPPPGTFPDPAGGRDCGHGELQVAQRRTTQRQTAEQRIDQRRTAQRRIDQWRTAPRRTAQRRARGRAHAVAAVFASYSGHNFYRRRRLLRPTHAIANRRLARGDLLSAGELAAIAALPVAEHTPGLVRAGARSVAPPPGVPCPGPDVKPLGDTTTSTETTTATTSDGGSGSGLLDAAAARGVRRGRAVGVRVADARHHVHLIGATGSGKSTVLVHQILADIRAGRGVVVIDPKGDLVTDVACRLPARVRARAVIIDPDLPGPPPTLNPLASPPDVRRGGDEMVAENLVSIFQRVFSAYWGPRVDDLMRAACLTLYAQPGRRSLADLPGLLTDPDVRARHMRAIRDPLLGEFWESYDQLSDTARAQLIAPLMNKVRALLLRPFTRAVLTGHPGAAGASSVNGATGAGGAVDMPAVLDGGILLARLPKGRLGDEGTRLVGSIVVAQVWAAATGRAVIPQHQRRDAALVIDECQNFLNLPYGIDEILAEARGLRLSVTLAHQNLAQLPRDLREGISANARNKIFFNVGPDDARDLARHTLPQLGEHDLAHLDAFHAAARLVNHGAETPAFTLRTRPLPPAQRRPQGSTRPRR